MAEVMPEAIRWGSKTDKLVRKQTGLKENVAIVGFSLEVEPSGSYMRMEIVQKVDPAFVDDLLKTSQRENNAAGN